jgi:hypothetical protein
MVSDNAKIPADDVMVFLKMMEKFETPLFDQSWRTFQKLSKECPDFFGWRQRCRDGSVAFGEFDRVASLYEIAGILVKRGALNEDLWFDAAPSSLGVWQKMAAWVRGYQNETANPLAYKNVEWLGLRHEQWLATKASG